MLYIIGTTQHLGVNCGTQRSDKVEHNYGSDKANIVKKNVNIVAW